MKKLLSGVCGQVSNQALFWVVFAVLVGGFVLISSSKNQGVSPSAQYVNPMQMYGTGPVSSAYGACSSRNDCNDPAFASYPFRECTGYAGPGTAGVCSYFNYPQQQLYTPPPVSVIPPYLNAPTPNISGADPRDPLLSGPSVFDIQGPDDILYPDSGLDSLCDVEKPPLKRSVREGSCDLLQNGSLDRNCDGASYKNNIPGLNVSTVLDYQTGCSLHFGRFNDPYSGGYATDKTKSELQNICDNGESDGSGNMVAIFEAEGEGSDSSSEDDSSVTSGGGTSDGGSPTSGALMAQSCSNHGGFLSQKVVTASAARQSGFTFDCSAGSAGSFYRRTGEVIEKTCKDSSKEYNCEVEFLPQR